jgi:2-dehydropantoate 2-reductase
MLQDIEAGKPTELEAIVGAIIELGEKLGVELPNTKSVYACVKLLEGASRRPT